MGCASSIASTPYKKATSEETETDTTSAAPASEAFVALFGETLRGKKGEIATEVALSGKAAVAIYFSAHWCPPCRGFTPALAKAYTQSLKAKGMEVVFVSSDRSDADFENYYNEMPWLAVPFAKREIKEKLSKRFKVQGIPNLVILDADANVITTDGRSKVTSDPTGTGFPWKPRPFAEIIGDKFLKGDTIVGKEAIAGKTLAIYFSAHWCPPCRGFTPKLAKHYSSYKEKGLPLEIIFSTGDKTEAEFKDYYKEMQSAGGDWLAIPWANSAQRSELDSLFEVSGIPCLVIVDENGQVINKNARGLVDSDPSGEGFPWAPPLVGNLAQPEGLNDTPSICVLMETAPEEQQKTIMTQIERVAERFAAAKSKSEDMPYLFFTARSSEGPVPQIRAMCGIPSDGVSQPVMLMLDIGDNGAYYRPAELDAEITVETIAAFIKAYEAKAIQRQQLKPPQ